MTDKFQSAFAPSVKVGACTHTLVFMAVDVCILGHCVKYLFTVDSAQKVEKI